MAGLFDSTTRVLPEDDPSDPPYELTVESWRNAVKRLTYQIHEETGAVWQRGLVDPFDLAAVLSAVEHVVRLVDAAESRKKRRAA